MTTNNHPAHGPVSLARLKQIREILSKAAAQSDGGNLGYAMADAVKVIDGVLSIPATLPCPVHLEPGLKFGKGVHTKCVLDALCRRADYYAELEAMTPEQRAEHDAGIAEFKAVLGNGGRGDMVDNDPQHAIHAAPTLYSDGKSAFPQRVMQSFGNTEQLDEVGSWNNHMNTPTANPAIDTGELLKHIEGMEVSVDVSTCDTDAGHRYFGTVTEISELDTAKNGYILLVQDAKPNFKQAGNSPVIGFDLASEPDRSVEVHYLAPPGYVMVPKKLTAENGAKGVLSGEFSETKFINCPECFGDDECETCDGSGRIEITVPVSWTNIKAIWAKGVEHFEAAPQQENV
ncbi:Molecular chaperone DnaJ [Citrobacter freundii]